MPDNNFLGWLMTGEAAAAKETSLNEIDSQIRNAVYRKFCPPQTPSFAPIPQAACDDFYINEVYGGYVIAQRGGEFFKVNYAIENGAVVVGDELIPVERVWVEKPQPAAGS